MTEEEDQLDSFIESRIEEIVKEISVKEPEKPTVKRKSVFNAPFKQSKMTQFYKEAKNRPGDDNCSNKIEEESSIERELVLTEQNSSEILSLLESCKELAMVIIFLEGFTQLRDSSCLGNNFGSAQCVMVRLTTTVGEEDTAIMVRVDLWNKTTSSRVKQFFWLEMLLHRQARKIVYDGKAFLKCVVSEYQEDEVKLEQVRLIDPLVGSWLLQPDRPPSSFLGCLQSLGLDRLASLGSRQTVAKDLALLSSLGQQLFRRLDSLKLWSVFYELEMRLLPHLVMMERRGVCLDQGRLQVLGQCLDRQLAKLEEGAHRIAGKQFNLCSPAQVRTILFDQLQLDTKADIHVGKTAGGVKSTCETVLQGLVSCHPLPGIILQHRQVAKYRTTYVEGLLQHCQGGRVFTCWDQLAAATGRLTSVSPNLQGIPKGEIEAGGQTINLRSSLVSSEERVFLCADFEQIELRIYAALSLDPGLMAATREGGDIFCKLAAAWLDRDQHLVTEDEREKTKRLVYALMYGAGKNKLSDILSVTVQQAGTIMASFYTKFATLKMFNQRVIAMAEKDGFLSTLLGRRRYFPGIRSSNMGVRSQSQRSAFNFLLQGSAADIAKMGLLAAQDRLQEAGVQAALLLMIHDELVWEVRPAELSRAAVIVLEALQDTKGFPLLKGEFKVPLPVKVRYGPSLGTLEVVKGGTAV